MSDREKCIAILNEAADDAFCESLYKQVEADPEKGEAVSLEEAARQLGVDLQ